MAEGWNAGGWGPAGLPPHPPQGQAGAPAAQPAGPGYAAGPGYHPPPPGAPHPGAGRGGAGRAVAIVLVVLLLAGAVGVGAWLLLRGSGGVAFAGLLVDGVTGEPEEAWAADVDGDVIGAFGTDDVVAILVDDGDEVRLSLLDAADGEERWSVDLDGPADTVVVGDAVVVGGAGTDASSLAGHDLEDGDELWADELGPDLFLEVLADGRITAYAFGDRTEVLRVDALEGDHERLARAEAVAIGPVLLEYAFGDEDVTGIDVGTGEEVREVEVESLVDDVPELGTAGGGDLVVAVVDGEATAYDADGEEMWSTDVDLADVPFVTDLQDGGVLLSTPDASVVLDGDGEERWDADDEVIVPIGLEGRGIVAIEDEDEVELLDAATGDRLGDVDTSFAGGYELAEGVVYTIDDEDVIAHSLPDGDELWRVDTGEELTSWWEVPGGVLVGDGEDAKLYR